LGAVAPAIHESLDLNRFRARWVQCLLPFRMPRALA
jgi:carotenoid 1,2-hydratase